MAVMPACSVVIVTWNRLDVLKRCLASVYAQVNAADLEVIVLDNGSTDGTREWLQSAPHPFRLILFDKNLGASGARNEGIRLATAPYVCFLDSDAIILSPDAIAACLATLAKGPARAVAVSIWLDAECTRPFTKGGYITPDGHFHGARTRSDYDDPHFLSSCFAVWEKGLLVELRGFDRWYFWGIEDMDLALRARHRLGVKFSILADRHVHHDMARTGRHYQPDDFGKVFRSIERQRLYLVLSYGGLKEWAKVLIRTPFRVVRVERDAWERKLTLWEKWLMVGWFPLLRMLALPKNLMDQRRNWLSQPDR